jgi:cytochrome oxidase Cu insertion factor (SCO1/SenC/PrrC family)
VTVADRDPESTAASSYEIAHSTQIVVVNPDGYYTGMLTAPHQPERIVKVLTSLMGE